jgi:transposase
MTYSPDMRAAALRCVSEGKSRLDIVNFFDISLKTLSNWVRQHRETGSLEPPPRKVYRQRKVIREQLLALIAEHPDATLEELAAPFQVSPSNIDYHLRKLGVTRKKNHALRGEKRRKA